jgi:urate oxidase
MKYTFDDLEIPVPSDERKLEFIPGKVVPGGVWDEDLWDRARRVTCEVFAEDDSASVQVCVSPPLPLPSLLILSFHRPLYTR